MFDRIKPARRGSADVDADDAAGNNMRIIMALISQINVVFFSGKLF